MGLCHRRRRTNPTIALHQACAFDLVKTRPTIAGMQVLVKGMKNAFVIE
jgi:hypothetical protein